ncbi:Zinc finger, CCHC-type [Sesbania bispinosa]|nr:Zinc finger, CCHC-type [Sesbania bispinosa]
MDEFFDASCVNLDDDNGDIYGNSDGFDVNNSEDNNELGGPNVVEELGNIDHNNKRIEDMSPDDIRSMEFASEEHGGLFYQAYAKRHGFVVRKDEVCRDIKDNVIMRQFVCNKEGTRSKKHLMRVDRKKDHRPITRVRCQAKLRIRLDYKTGLNDADKAQVDRLHAYGVRTCHIMGKDLYNYIERQKLEKIKDGDAHAALCYIQAKANNDPTLRSSFVASEDEFLRAMSDKHPAAVVTDGDNSMREAIKQAAMYSNFTVDQFELFWKRMVAKHGLMGNKWVSKTYENRFEQVLREYRNNEMIADFKSLFTEPVLTTSLKENEREASKIFTLEIFREVKSEIEVAGALNVNERLEHGDKLNFKLNHYCNRGSQFEVEYDVVNSKFLCECRLFESRGIPCSHIICVLKNESMQSMPSSLIVKRWTKKCKSDLISIYQADDVDNDVMKEARLGAVGGAFQRLGCIAKEKKEYFNDIINDVLKLVQKYERIGEPHGTQTSREKIVKDPPVVKTKGASPKRKYGRKRKRCSNCNRTGHILKRCPNLYGRTEEKMDEDKSPLGQDEDREGTPLDEVNGHGMEPSNQTQRVNHNEVNVKISDSRKGKEKQCTQEVEVKVSGINEGKEKECTQEVTVKLSGTREVKGKEVQVMSQKSYPITVSTTRMCETHPTKEIQGLNGLNIETLMLS